MEGGRFMVKAARDKKRPGLSPVKGNKRIRQNIELDSDENDMDEDFAPKGTVNSDFLIIKIEIFVGKLTVPPSDRKTRN